MVALIGRKKMWIGLLMAYTVLGVAFPAACEPSSSGHVLELNATDRNALAVLGNGVVGKALSARPLGNVAELLPLREGEWVYRITAGEHEGVHQQVTVAETTGRGGRKLWKKAIKGDVTEFYSYENGGIHRVRENDYSQKVITSAKPALPIMFKGMKPGESSQGETVLKVHDLSDPTDLKYKGHLKVTHTYVGAYEVNVPAGKFQTVLIRSTYDGKVGPAHVVDGEYAFYAKGVGVVASIERKHVTAFLFYNKRKKTPKVLIRK